MNNQKLKRIAKEKAIEEAAEEYAKSVELMEGEPPPDEYILNYLIKTAFIAGANLSFNDRQMKSKVESLKKKISFWNDKKNQRRCELVDKSIDSTITEEENKELDVLQKEVEIYLKIVAPLPIELPKMLNYRLERMLKEKKND